MLATFVIVSRESLEAALAVGILSATARGVPGYRHWLLAGVVAGVLGSLALAAGMQTLAGMADGQGQDWLNIAILVTALAMLGWHARGMRAQQRRAGQAAGSLRDRGSLALAGRRPLLALAVVVALAILREGAETVLMLGGVLQDHGAGPVPDESWAQAWAGAGGLACGVVAGVLVSFGLARVPVRHVFLTLNTLVLVVAAGLFWQLVQALDQAGLFA